MWDHPIIFEKIINTKETKTAMSVEGNHPIDQYSHSTPKNSQAEVRLVVRFIVEEQIVYNGKVEKVNQLDSQELSRIVSRIAWDGATQVETIDQSVVNPLSILVDNPDNDTVIDCQSISDTLNDCVNIVELENRLMDEELMKNSDNAKMIYPDQDKNVAISEQSCSNQIADIDMEPSKGEEKLEEKQENMIHQDQQLPSSERSIETAKTSTITMTSVPEKDENSTPNESMSSISADITMEKKDQTLSVSPIVQKPQLTSCESGFTVDNSSDAESLPLDNLESPIGKRRHSQYPSSQKRTRRESYRDNKNMSGPMKPTQQNSKLADENGHDLIIAKQLTETISNENIQDNNQIATTLPRSSPTTNSHILNHTKILAKWTDNHFYPGTVLKQAKGRKYVIGFFDGATRTVSETDLIPLPNIQGKQVRVSIAKNYCLNATVLQQLSNTKDQPMFNVEYQQDGVIKKCVPLGDIFLTADQGTPLINQVDRNPSASNFADVDLDNIIYEKRSRRQELDDYEQMELNQPASTPISTNQYSHGIGSRRKSRGNQYSIRNTSHHSSADSEAKSVTNIDINTTKIYNNKSLSSDSGFESSKQKLTPQSDTRSNHESEAASSPDMSKINSVGPNSNSPSGGSSPLISSNLIQNDMELDEEGFYFANSSPHRTKTSLLL